MNSLRNLSFITGRVGSVFWKLGKTFRQVFPALLKGFLPLFSKDSFAPQWPKYSLQDFRVDKCRKSCVMLGVQGQVNAVPDPLDSWTKFHPSKTQVLCSVAQFSFVSANNIFLSAVNGAPITC